MLTFLLIILLILLVIYLYYQNKKLSASSDSNTNSSSPSNKNTLIFDENWETKTSETIKNLELEVNELTTERDEVIREQKTSEQEIISLSNKFKNKIQEVTNKDQQIQLLKKEKSQAEISLNQKLTELKTKHSKQGKLLDEEQCENNKLTEKIESLEEEIKALKSAKTPEEFAEETETLSPEKLAEFITWAQKYEEFAKVDWDYYRKQENWEKSFRQWNALRTDRLELLEEWKEQND